MAERQRVLFVDDESSIRVTLPLVLERKGFEVLAAGSVAEAIAAIGQSRFDILISDLNIGEPGDGFTVVSAMRRVQPQCRSFILTGYPDFDSALRAIRNQVDDYLVKPADPEILVETLQHKILEPDRTPYGPLKETSQLLRELQPHIIRSLVEQVRARLEFRDLAEREIAEPVSVILTELINRVRTGADEMTGDAKAFASAYGIRRQQQGYSVAMLVSEGHALQRAISKSLQDNLLRIEMSTIIVDMIRIGESLTGFLEEAVGAFTRASLPHTA